MSTTPKLLRTLNQLLPFKGIFGGSLPSRIKVRRGFGVFDPSRVPTNKGRALPSPTRTQPVSFTRLSSSIQTAMQHFWADQLTTLSHKMYQLNGFRESTFRQNRQLIVLISDSKQ